MIVIINEILTQETNQILQKKKRHFLSYKPPVSDYTKFLIHLRHTDLKSKLAPSF